MHYSKWIDKWVRHLQCATNLQSQTLHASPNSHYLSWNILLIAWLENDFGLSSAIDNHWAYLGYKIRRDIYELQERDPRLIGQRHQTHEKHQTELCRTASGWGHNVQEAPRNEHRRLAMGFWLFRPITVLGTVMQFEKDDPASSRMSGTRLYICPTSLNRESFGKCFSANSRWAV